MGRAAWTTGALALVLGTCSWASSARADAPEGLVLTWHAPEGCPAEDEVRAEVVSLLGEGVAAVLPVRADAELTPREGGWSLVLHTVIEETEGERTLDGETCEEVARAAALVLALALSGAERPPPQAPRVRFVSQVPVEAAFGVLPAPTLVLGLDVAIEIDALRIVAAGRVTPEAGVTYPSDATRGATLLAGWAELGVAGVLRPVDGVALVLGGGALAGALAGRSFGVTMPASGLAPRVSLLARASLELAPTSWLVVAAFAVLEVALVRPLVTIEGLPDLARAEPVAARLGGAIGVSLP